MIAADRAAREINQRWVNCIGHSQVDLATCPTDEDVAEIIVRHLEKESDSPKSPITEQ